MSAYALGSSLSTVGYRCPADGFPGIPRDGSALRRPAHGLISRTFTRWRIVTLRSWHPLSARKAPSRSRVRRWPRSTLRAMLGVNGKPLHGLSGPEARSWRLGRIQRQIYAEPDDSALGIPCTTSRRETSSCSLCMRPPQQLPAAKHCSSAKGRMARALVDRRISIPSFRIL